MATKLPDELLSEWTSDGWFLLPGFLDGAELAEARNEVEAVFPGAAEFAADPDAPGNAALRRSQFAGMMPFPFPSAKLNRLVVEPNLVDFAERLLGTQDIRIYQAALWAKYGSAIDYDQQLHVDYRNHTLVVPRRDQEYRQFQTFIYLSDVTLDNGATRLVKRRLTSHLPMEPKELQRDRWPGVYAAETAAVGPAGSLLAWGPDVFHRGTAFHDPQESRFVLVVSYISAGKPWMGHHNWPSRARDPKWPEFVASASPRELALFGFPEPGDPYWNAETLAGVALRYPGLDMTPWREGCR